MIIFAFDVIKTRKRHTMANFRTDSRIVMTLDANSAVMVFGAMQGGEFIVDPITLDANAHDLDLCLQTMVKGFRMVRDQLDRQPAAISFAFPGPADYPNGIIYGYLLNFPSFRGGVALGPYLRKKFGIPVYINNDGDLFAYGEALGGVLPDINERLELAGSSKRYRNLLGYVFGDGFGVGMIVNGMLNRGDNSCVETCYFPHAKRPDIIVEEGVSIRAVKRVYKELSSDERELEPKDIFETATLPLTIACCEKRGISHKVTSFVIPLGATLNMDGTALLQVIAVIFLTQAYGVVLTPLMIVQVALLTIIASSTSAGIPGAGLITIALVLNGLGLSPEQLVAGFAFLFTIERITDMMRTLVNVTSDAVVAAAIADNENEINYDLLNNPSEYNEVID